MFFRCSLLQSVDWVKIRFCRMNKVRYLDCDNDVSNASMVL